MEGTAVDVEDDTAIPAFQAGEAVEAEMGTPNVRGGAVVVELKAKNNQDIVRVHLECIVVAKDEDEELQNLAEEAKFNQKKQPKEFSTVGSQTNAAKAGANADVTSTPATAPVEAVSTSI
jgi:hypothetical protein